MHYRNKPRKPKPTENRNSGRILAGPAPAVFVVYCDAVPPIKLEKFEKKM